MNREEYLSELYGRLRQRLPGGELEHIMKYYEEYFNEAGPEREAEIMADLGSPEDLSRQILGGRGVNTPPDYRYEQPQRRTWTGGKIALLICLFPIWLPLLIAIPAVAFGAVVAIGAAGIGCIGGGIFAVWCGFTALFTPGFATTMVFGGLGLLLAGFGLAMLVGAVALGKVCGKGIGTLCHWIFVGSRGGAAV